MENSLPVSPEAITGLICLPPIRGPHTQTGYMTERACTWLDLAVLTIYVTAHLIRHFSHLQTVGQFSFTNWHQTERHLPVRTRIPMQAIMCWQPTSKKAANIWLWRSPAVAIMRWQRMWNRISILLDSKSLWLIMPSSPIQLMPQKCCGHLPLMAMVLM